MTNRGFSGKCFAAFQRYVAGDLHITIFLMKAHPGMLLFSLELAPKQEKTPGSRHKLSFVVTVETSAHRWFSLELLWVDKVPQQKHGSVSQALGRVWVGTGGN